MSGFRNRRKALLTRPSGPPRLNRDSPQMVGLQFFWPVWQHGGQQIRNLPEFNKAVLTPNTAAASFVPFELGGRIAPRVDGNNDYYITADSHAHHANVTVFMWIYRTISGNGRGSLLAHHTEVGNASDYFLYFTSNKLTIDIPWVAGAVHTGTNDIVLNEPLFVGFNRTGSTGAWTYETFINGRSDGSSATASNPNTGAHTYQTHGFNSSGSWSTATPRICHIGISNRVWSDQEWWEAYSSKRWDLYWRPKVIVPGFMAAEGGRIMSSLTAEGGLAGMGGIAGAGGGLAG